MSIYFKIKFTVLQFKLNISNTRILNSPHLEALPLQDVTYWTCHSISQTFFITNKFLGPLEVLDIESLMYIENWKIESPSFNFLHPSRFPANQDQRNQWISKLRRWKWMPSKYSYICCDNFLISDYKVPPGHCQC